MPNTHAIPDTFYEHQATWGDLGPAVIVAHTGLTVPASSLTMPAVAANGYVLAAGPPARLVYVSQAAVSVTLAGGNGTYWLALHTDLSTAVAGWTRRAGSHYVWQMNATQPANPANSLVFCQVTVAGGVITAVNPLLPVTSPPMSKQNSNAVAITGGGIAGTQLSGPSLGVGAPAPATANQTYLNGPVGIQEAPNAGFAVTLLYNKGTQYGLVFHTVNTNTGNYTVAFCNVAGSVVGSIDATASATAFNTSSDVRLKRNIAPLTGALERVRALRPVAFRWQADDSPGVGYLAHELMTVVPEAVTGLPDAVDAQGEIVPQQVDHSKIVPWLTAGLQAALAQIDVLTARLTTLEEQLGL